MTPSEIYKKSLEGYVKLRERYITDLLSYYHSQMSGTDEEREMFRKEAEKSRLLINNFFKSHTLNILKEEVNRLEKILKQVIKKKNSIENDPFHPARCQYLGQQDALQDQITHLNQEIKNIEEM